MGRLSISKNPQEVLDKIVELHGIEVVKDCIKRYNKRNRLKMKRGNNYKEIGNQVANLRLQGYSLVRAYDEIAEKNNISTNTVKNHYAKYKQDLKREFNPKAIAKLDFDYDPHDINAYFRFEQISSIYDIDPVTLEINYKNYANQKTINSQIYKIDDEAIAEIKKEYEKMVEKQRKEEEEYYKMVEKQRKEKEEYYKKNNYTDTTAEDDIPF